MIGKIIKSQTQNRVTTIVIQDETNPDNILTLTNLVEATPISLIINSTGQIVRKMTCNMVSASNEDSEKRYEAEIDVTPYPEIGKDFNTKEYIGLRVRIL